MPNLRKLNIARNPLSVVGIDALLQTMVENNQAKNMRSMTFTGIPLGDEGLKCVLQYVAEHFYNLTYLNLVACRSTAVSI
jgi:hypothetical protein